MSDISPEPVDSMPHGHDKSSTGQPAQQNIATDTDSLKIVTPATDYTLTGMTSKLSITPELIGSTCVVIAGALFAAVVVDMSDCVSKSAYHLQQDLTKATYTLVHSAVLIIIGWSILLLADHLEAHCPDDAGDKQDSTITSVKHKGPDTLHEANIKGQDTKDAAELSDTGLDATPKLGAHKFREQAALIDEAGDRGRQQHGRRATPQGHKAKPTIDEHSSSVIDPSAAPATGERKRNAGALKKKPVPKYEYLSDASSRDSSPASGRDVGDKKIAWKLVGGR